ncbi:MAG: anaerobic ribonucleoside-triphosphate reductase activating protein [Anaerolineae bacterium]|nr:anaerobic ribonucleoside-triphosphate reductase activating protein [Anaerolineae bacterium]
MDLRGWVRTSLIDYPEHIATVLFTGGCNFRCPMCHNADLVLRPAELPALHEEAVWELLARRSGLLDGVVLTGGEPTLQNDLLPFIRRVREYGLDVKLDTNGYRPDVLEALLQEGLLDYVAMDVKSPPEKLAHLTGVPGIVRERIDRSIDLLRSGRIAYEFRTTVVPGLLVEDDIEAIASWVAGATRYALQQFRTLNTLDPALEHVSPYSTDVLHRMAKRAAKWVGEVVVR